MGLYPIAIATTNASISGTGDDMASLYILQHPTELCVVYWFCCESTFDDVHICYTFTGFNTRTHLCTPNSQSYHPPCPANPSFLPLPAGEELV